MERRSFLRSLLATAIGASMGIDVPAIEKVGLKAVTLGKGGWHHVAFTRSAGDTKLYVNGSQVSDITDLYVGEVNGGLVVRTPEPWKGDTKVVDFKLPQSMADDFTLEFHIKKS